MTLSPRERKEVLSMVADRLVAQVTAEKGGLADLVLVPVAVAESITGLDSRTLRQRMDFVEIAPKKHKVRLSDIKKMVERRAK